MKRTAEFVLGLMGGIFGIISGIMALMLGGIGTAVGSGSGGLGTLGTWAIVLSVLGIVGACMVSGKAKLGGWFMLIAAIGGTISVSFFYILPGLLLLIGGLMSLIRKDRSTIEVVVNK
jgi:hypothetical protein